MFRVKRGSDVMPNFSRNNVIEVASNEQYVVEGLVGGVVNVGVKGFQDLIPFGIGDPFDMKGL